MTAADRGLRERLGLSVPVIAAPMAGAPKLALGMAAEQGGGADVAASWYDVVSRTDPSYTSASFGLARCRVTTGDPSGAVDAYERVPGTSSAHVDAQVAEAQLLLDGDLPDRVGSLRRAAQIVEQLPLDRAQRRRLTAEVLEATLAAVCDSASPPDPAATVFGCRFDRARAARCPGGRLPRPRAPRHDAGRAHLRGRAGEPGPSPLTAVTVPSNPAER